jgi:hypothetical protein
MDAMQAADDAVFYDNEWYVLKNGETLGPITADDLKARVAGGLVRGTDLVWRHGLDLWTAVNDVPAFAPAPVEAQPPLPAAFTPPPDFPAAPGPVQILAPERAAAPATPGNARPTPPPLPEYFTASDDAAADGRAGSSANYFVRHWRGDLSLTASFWFNGCIGYVLITVINTLILAGSGIGEKFRPGVVLAAAAATWLVTVAAVAWLVTGAWRSATRYGKGKGGLNWAALAKLVLVLCVASTVVSFVQSGAPQLRELYQIYAGDERVGKYTFRVLREGRELEFSGGIPFGAADDFQRFIDAMGSVQLIHLNSDGGRISEAQLIAQIIQKRHLSTYVANRCLSACTIIFLSGRERLISTQGRLGFHQPDFPGMTAEERREAIATEERRLQQLGLSAEFARRANLAPPNDMWLPTAPELLKEGVVTQVVNSFDYALSGLGQTIPTRSELEKILLSNDIYKSFRQMSRESYDKVLDSFESSIRRGLSFAELRAEISPIIVEKYNEILPFTSDENLLTFARLVIRHSAVYNRADPATCYFNLNPEKSTPVALLDMRQRHKDLADEEDSFMSHIFSSYSGKTAKIPQQKEVSKSIDRVMSALSRRRDVDVALLSASEIPPEKYKRYCDAFIAMYEETLRLPRREAAMLIRFFLASK